MNPRSRKGMAKVERRVRGRIMSRLLHPRSARQPRLGWNFSAHFFAGGAELLTVGGNEVRLLAAMQQEREDSTDAFAAVVPRCLRKNLFELRQQRPPLGVADLRVTRVIAAR